jgi:hypothetical protein
MRVIDPTARIAAGLALVAAGLIGTLPQPTARLWQTSVLINEWGHWLGLVALILLIGCHRSAGRVVAAVIGLAGSVLLLLPLAQARALNTSLPPELTAAFGPGSTCTVRGLPRVCSRSS